MCISVRVSEMSDTKLYAGEALKDGKLVHVLAYQNSAVSDGPNAMVLPFPTSAKMDESNIINTTDFKSFLKDITNATRQQTKRARSASFGADSMLLGKSMRSLAKVFDVGSYTVILAESAGQIPEAVKRVGIDRRPVVTDDFLRGFAALYPNQPIAICCWNGSIEAEPLLWWYEPRDASTLFVPTMDAHDGKAPVLGALVETDHIITVGSTSFGSPGEEVTYKCDLPKDVKALLPKRANGKRLPSLAENADSFVKTAALHPTKEDLFKSDNSVTLTRGLDYKSVMNGWH